jgi:probable HAF family extracellular repeat protein
MNPKLPDGFLSIVRARCSSTREALGAALIIASCGVLSDVLARPALAQCSYEFEVIQGPPCGIGFSLAVGTAINDNGDVAGFYYPCDAGPVRGFSWTKQGGFQTLPPLGLPLGGDMTAQDINDDRVIVGAADIAGLGTRGFILEAGVYTLLPPVYDVPGASSGASAINNAGIVVGGRSTTPAYNPRNAFVWSKRMGFIDLGLMGATANSASAITDAGVVTGNTYSPSIEGFRWQNGALEMLGNPDGAEFSNVGGAGADRIAGAAFYPSGPWPIVWSDAGGWSQLPLPFGCGRGSASDASQLTNEVVGSCSSESQPSAFMGMIWYETTPYRLIDLVLDPPDGMEIERVHGINRNGQIVAEGGYPGGGGGTLILTPIDASPADANGDCITNFRDLLLVLSRWTDSNEAADFDGNGIVGFGDLLMLLSNWTVIP